MNTKTFICAQIARSHGNHQNRSIRSLPIKACRKTATGRYHHKLHPSSCSVVVCQLSLALALSFFASNASLSGRGICLDDTIDFTLALTDLATTAAGHTHCIHCAKAAV